MRDNVDESAALAFLTLMYDPEAESDSHERAVHDLLAGDLEPLVWGLAVIAASAVGTLAEKLSLSPEVVIQTIGESFAAGDPDPL